MSDAGSSSSSSSYIGSGQSITSEESPIRSVVDQLEAAFSSLHLDRAQVAQAQLSGSIRAQSAELALYQDKIAQELPKIRAKAPVFKELVKSIKTDLEWLDKHLRKLESRARKSYPIEYAEAHEKITHPRGD